MARRSKSFQHFFKLFPLFRRKLLANLLADIQQHLVHLGRNIGPNLAVAFLPVGDDFGNRGALFPREMKRVVQLLHELPAENFRLAWFEQIQRARMVRVTIIRLELRIPLIQRTLNLLGMRRLRIIDQQTAGQRTRAKNHHYRQNNFPRIHCI